MVFPEIQSAKFLLEWNFDNTWCQNFLGSSHYFFHKNLIKQSFIAHSLVFPHSHTPKPLNSCRSRRVVRKKYNYSFHTTRRGRQGPHVLITLKHLREDHHLMVAWIKRERHTVRLSLPSYTNQEETNLQIIDRRQYCLTFRIFVETELSILRLYHTC